MTDIETLAWTAREILPLYQRDWLTKAMEILKWDFEQIGEAYSGAIDIRVDFPDRGIHLAWLGMYCRDTVDHATGDGVFRRIFINPTVDGLTALDVLVHELVHAVTEEEGGHGGMFRRVAKAIGMDDGGMTSGAEEDLLRRLREIQQTLGSYPLVFDFV